MFRLYKAASLYNISLRILLLNKINKSYRAKLSRLSMKYP